MPMTVCYNLLKIYENLLDAAKFKKKSLDISFSIYFFRMKHLNFGQNEQNDSIEFYRVLSEDVNIELNEAGKKFKYKEIMYSNDNDKVIMNEEFIKYFKEK